MACSLLLKNHGWKQQLHRKPGISNKRINVTSKGIRRFFQLDSASLAASSSSDFSVPGQARVVICGAGVVGNSVAYHLVQSGWKDVVVVEQGKIGCGESWRGCGIVGPFHSSSAGIITQYSAKLFKDLHEQGHDIGWKSCGSINVARTSERVISLHRQVGEARAQGIECEFLGPSEISKLHPLIRTDDLKGAVWIPADGVADSFEVCKVLAKLAQQGGARYFEGCKLEKILTQDRRVSAVHTSHGSIQCEFLVICAGMWSRQLGLECIPKFRVPIQVAEHSFVITQPVPSMPASLPIIRDYDGHVYCREHNGAFLAGGFPVDARIVFEQGIPPTFEFQTLPPDWKMFQTLYDQIVRRVPIISQAQPKQLLCGPDTFSPDSEWILGETAEVDNLFVAGGMNGNPLKAAGGVGRAVANWIMNGEPEGYLLPFDIRRFIDMHNNKQFLKERVKEAVGRQYAIPHPLYMESITARKLRCSPLYTAQEAAGAVFGERMGFERALYFDPNKDKKQRIPPTPTFGKPPWFDNVRVEYQACRERVGLIDMSSFTKFHLKSAGTEVVDYLQHLCSNDVDVPVGYMVQTGMQNDRGGYENDCLLVRRAENCYFMVSPTAQQTRISEWMRKHLPPGGSVSISDVTSMYSVLNVVGPKSKELMAELTQTDMKLPAFTCQRMNVGYATGVLVMAFNNTGEPGYSLYIPSEYALHVYNRLMTIGRDYGIKDAGYYALRFLRIEKFIPFWAEELDSNTTPFEVGRGYKVKMQKQYFLGKYALQQQLERGLWRRLVHFQLEGHDADRDYWPWGGEPIKRNGKYVGMTTSGGYGLTLEKMVCSGFVQNVDENSGQPLVVTNDFVMKDAKFEIEIAGKCFPAKGSLHAPKIPVVPMGGTNIRFVPKARVSAAGKK